MTFRQEKPQPTNKIRVIDMPIHYAAMVYIYANILAYFLMYPLRLGIYLEHLTFITVILLTIAYLWVCIKDGFAEHLDRRIDLFTHGEENYFRYTDRSG